MAIHAVFKPCWNRIHLWLPVPVLTGHAGEYEAIPHDADATGPEFILAIARVMDARDVPVAECSRSLPTLPVCVSHCREIKKEKKKKPRRPLEAPSWNSTEESQPRGNDWNNNVVKRGWGEIFEIRGSVYSNKCRNLT